MIGTEGAISPTADTKGKIAHLRNPIVTALTATMATTTTTRSQNKGKGKDLTTEIEGNPTKTKATTAEKIPATNKDITLPSQSKPIKYPTKYTNSRTTWRCTRRTIAFQKK